VLQKIQVFWDVTACELHQGLLDPQNEGTLIIQDVGNHLKNKNTPDEKKCQPFS